MSSLPGFLSPSSPPSSHLHFVMASVAVPTNLPHLPAPDTANPQDLSRPPAGQPHFDSLVNTPASSRLEDSQPPENTASQRHSSSPQTAQTIQSILTASNDPSEASSSSQLPPWNTQPAMGHPPREPHGSLPGPSAASQRTSTKRKLDTLDADDPHNKIRRVVRDHVAQNTLRPIPMTTVLCLHAAVAQKSYGTEKRFLCPPPIVHIEGPVWNMKSQQLSMTVVSEGGERSYEQRAPIDHNLSASFKFLHVTGSAKSKSFQLSLDIAEPAPPAPDGSEGSGPGRVWASFDSAPVTIISKPSKKTAKTRNIASCILAGGPVSLFNRINSQTVRTKYMTADNGQLCASNVSWTAFNVNVPHPTGETPAIGPQPVTYGSVIDLVDPLSHTQMLRLTIRKVDKGRIAPDDGGPVSQMQKIALQRTNSDGSRHYLSAASPVPGAQGVGAGQNAASQSGTHPLVWQAPRVREETREGVRVITDEVDDYLCWTIVGISKFQYTFFDAFGHAEPPEMPITPFPTLFNVPILHPTNDSNTLELTVANFFFQHPQTREQMPLNIYLGNIGPLQHNILPPNPPGPLTSISTYVNAIGADGVQRDEPVGAGMSSVDQGYLGVPPIHTSLTVDLPSIATILQALQDDLEPSTRDGPAPQNGSDGKFNVAALNGRSLPLLFIRTVDGVGYHSGRAIAVENVFHALEEMNGGGAGWPQMAEGMQGMLNSQWHLRVI